MEGYAPLPNKLKDTRMESLTGWIAIGMTTLIGVVVSAAWKKITTSASSHDLEKVERASTEGRKELWLEVNQMKIEQAKSEAFREAISKQLDMMDKKIDKIYESLEKKQNKE